jgi:nucleotide-binding universal stress UspA family protein
MKVKPTSTPGRVVVQLDRRDERILEDTTRGAAEPTTPFKLKRLLVPVDFSDRSKKALSYALAFARQFDASLTLVHVVQINYAYGEMGAIDYTVLEKEMRQAAEMRLAKLAAELSGHQIPTETLVRCGAPARVIAECAKELDIDMVVLTTHGYTGLKHVLLGSVAENIVRHAPCPVLVVREREHDFVGT